MLKDLAIMLLFVCLFVIALMVVGGVAEYILFPLLDYLEAKRKRKGVKRMAMICVTGGSKCDGCGRCHDEPRAAAICDACHEAICVGEDHYEIEGDTIHVDCLIDRAKSYFVRGDA